MPPATAMQGDRGSPPLCSGGTQGTPPRLWGQGGRGPGVLLPLTALSTSCSSSVARSWRLTRVRV